MYQTIPEEYAERKRGSDLEDIAEVDECYYEDESDQTSRGSSSSAPSPAPPGGSLHHLQLPAIQRDVYLRSHSAGDEVTPRPSLLGPGPLMKKGAKIKRTESQNRADYLLRV